MNSCTRSLISCGIFQRCIKLYAAKFDLLDEKNVLSFSSLHFAYFQFKTVVRRLFAVRYEIKITLVPVLGFGILERVLLGFY